MLVRPRVIPCLLIDHGRLVKTVKFNRKRYLGDPINAVRIYNEKEVDEVCILDIKASVEKNGPDFDLLKEIASEAFMPLSYGGGIHSLQDAEKLFKIGFEKIIVNSGLANAPQFVEQLVNEFGSQSVVASIDYKKDFWGHVNSYIYGGRKNTKKEILQCAQQAQSIGVGEILLNSINRDGMMNGYDLDIIKRVAENVKIPVICCGGASGIGDLAKGLHEGHASAVAAGSIFVYYGSNKAVLINYPTEDELIGANVYYEQSLSNL